MSGGTLVFTTVNPGKAAAAGVDGLLGGLESGGLASTRDAMVAGGGEIPSAGRARLENLACGRATASIKERGHWTITSDNAYTTILFIAYTTIFFMH